MDWIKNALSSMWAGVAEFFSDIWSSLRRTIAVCLIIIAIVLIILAIIYSAGLASAPAWLSLPALKWGAVVLLCTAFVVDPVTLTDVIGIFTGTMSTIVSGTAGVIADTLTSLVDPDKDGKIFGIPLIVWGLGGAYLMLRD